MLALVGAAVALAGCGSTDHSRAVRVAPAARRASAPVPSVASTTTTLPVAPVTWSACQNGLQCATVTVPLDYAEPAGPTLAVALARHPASDPAARIGALIFDPGGPGGSGIDNLPTELGVLGPDVLARYDVVSLDPRGVGRSSPVRCAAADGTSTPGPLIDPVPTDLAAQLALIADFRAYATSCQATSGALLAHVGTVDVARDLDRIRAAMGEPSISYVGYSYGTLLGATYASMFPTHVHSLVLDGAIDPAVSSDDMSLQQAQGYETSFTTFASWCSGSPACSWRPTSDPTTALLALVDRARAAPLPAGGGRVVGPGEIYDALLGGLDARSFWPTLGTALADAASGDGAAVASMADHYRNAGSSNASDAVEAIDCSDHPVSRDLAVYPGLAARDSAVAPIFGPLLAWGEAGCAVWPVLPSRQPSALHDTGAPPALVVGTTGDPATPYRWAQALAGDLAGSALLTRIGQDHVASYTSICVRSAVTAYLLDGTLPPPGATCSG